MRVDPERRKLKRGDIAEMKDRIRAWPVKSNLPREYDVELFKWSSEYPVVRLPSKGVVDPFWQIEREDLWAYEYRFWYTHMDEDGHYWTKPGHELLEGWYENLDGSIHTEEVPRYLSVYEDAYRFKTSFLGVQDVLLWLREVPDEEDEHWLALIVDQQGNEFAHAEGDGEARAIVTAVLTCMLEHPHLSWMVDIVD